MLQAASALEPGGDEQFFVWNQKRFPCTPNSLAEGVEFEIGGKIITASLRLFVLAEHFISLDSSLITMDSEEITMDEQSGTPVAGQTLLFPAEQFEAAPTMDSTLITMDTDITVDTEAAITRWRGTRYRILSVRLSAPQDHYEILLGNPKSNR